MFHKIAFISTGLAAAMCAPLQAQSNDQWTVDQIIFGTGQYDFESSDVQAVGDVDLNGDGWLDVVTSVTGGGIHASSIHCHSGRTGYSLGYEFDWEAEFSNSMARVRQLAAARLKKPSANPESRLGKGVDFGDQ